MSAADFPTFLDLPDDTGVNEEQTPVQQEPLYSDKEREEQTALTFTNFARLHDLESDETVGHKIQHIMDLVYVPVFQGEAKLDGQPYHATDAQAPAEIFVALDRLYSAKVVLQVATLFELLTPEQVDAHLGRVTEAIQAVQIALRALLGNDELTDSLVKQCEEGATQSIHSAERMVQQIRYVNRLKATMAAAATLDREEDEE